MQDVLPFSHQGEWEESQQWYLVLEMVRFFFYLFKKKLRTENEELYASSWLSKPIKNVIRLDFSITRWFGKDK